MSQTLFILDQDIQLGAEIIKKGSTLLVSQKKVEDQLLKGEYSIPDLLNGDVDPYSIIVDELVSFYKDRDFSFIYFDGPYSSMSSYRKRKKCDVKVDKYKNQIVLKFGNIESYTQHHGEKQDVVVYEFNKKLKLSLAETRKFIDNLLGPRRALASQYGVDHKVFPKEAVDFGPPKFNFSLNQYFSNLEDFRKKIKPVTHLLNY